MSDEPTPKRNFIGPLFYCVLPVVVGLLLVVWVNRDAGDANEPDNTTSDAIPNLGGRSSDMGPPANTASDDVQNEPKDNSAPTNDSGDPDTKDPEPTAEPENSELEIDGHLKALAHAARVGTRRDINIQHDWLNTARPDDRVDARVRHFIETEPMARVRIEYFRAFHLSANAQQWAWEQVGASMDKMLGSTKELKYAEANELGLLLKSCLQDDTHKDFTQTVRGILQGSDVDWVLIAVAEALTDHSDRKILLVFQDDLLRVAKRDVLEQKLRDVFATLWMDSHDDINELIQKLRAGDLRPLSASALRDKDLIQRAPEAWAKFFDETLRLSKDSTDEADWMRRAIQRLRGHVFAESVIRNGVERNDALIGDWLKALGGVSRRPEDLDRLRRRANDANPMTALGAVSGLANSALPDADIQLKDIVENGSNAAVQSVALGALLRRNPYDRRELLNKYLAADQKQSIASVAVAHLTPKDRERLMELAEKDERLRVREAAIKKLGETDYESVRDRKEMYMFFKKLGMHDASPALRQLAKTYAKKNKVK